MVGDVIENEICMICIVFEKPLQEAKRRGKYPLLATDTEVNNCTKTEIIEHKMMIFNSFTVANDYNFGARWPNELYS